MPRVAYVDRVPIWGGGIVSDNAARLRYLVLSGLAKPLAKIRRARPPNTCLSAGLQASRTSEKGPFL